MTNYLCQTFGECYTHWLESDCTLLSTNFLANQGLAKNNMACNIGVTTTGPFYLLRLDNREGPMSWKIIILWWTTGDGLWAEKYIEAECQDSKKPPSCTLFLAQIQIQNQKHFIFLSQHYPSLYTWLTSLSINLFSQLHPHYYCASRITIQWLPKLPQCLHVLQRFKNCTSISWLFIKIIFVS